MSVNLENQKSTIYAALEREMLDYPDYAHMPAIDNGEELISIEETDNLTTQNIAEYMRPFTGDRIYVRQGVLDGLTHAATLLASMDSKMRLEVVCGYRDLGIQRQRFEKRKAEIHEATGKTGDALMAATHRIIAVPEAAGHPAGAAVDLQITKNGKPLDFGTPIWQFTPDSYARSPFISRKARVNREMLRAVMMAPQPGATDEGTGNFAPYDGEWWHFSRGDKEATRYYNLASAQYEQVDFRVAQ